MFASTLRVRCCNAMVAAPSSISAVVVPSTSLSRMASTTINANIIRSCSGNKNLLVASQFRQLHILLMNKPQPSNLSSTVVFRRMESTTTTSTTVTTTPGSTATAAKEGATASTASGAASATVTTAKQQSQGGGGGGWWHSAELWGTAGALACWGMAGSASYV